MSNQAKHGGLRKRLHEFGLNIDRPSEEMLEGQGGEHLQGLAHIRVHSRWLPVPPENNLYRARLVHFISRALHSKRVKFLMHAILEQGK